MGVDVGDVVSEAPRTTGLAIGHDPDRLDVVIPTTPFILDLIGRPL